MYERIIKFEDILNSVRKNHGRITYSNDIKRAYDYACEKHSEQVRHSGEPYIYHPMRVSKILADWGFESEVIIAGLLHDVVEDCDVPINDIEYRFGSSVAKMVDTVTHLNKDVKELEGLSKEDINRLSDAKLQKYITDKALYIKLADRLDNLYTIDVMPKEKQLEKAAHTRMMLLPMAMQIKAYKIVNDLEELCFMIEHESQYHDISSNMNNYIDSNIRSINKTIILLEDCFKKGRVPNNSNSSTFPNDLKPYNKFITDFVYNERSKSSIFRQITNNADNIHNDFNKILTKKNIAYYDLTLVFDDVIDDVASVLTPYDIFYKYYELYLMNHNIYILNYQQTTQKDCVYFLISDEMENLYRLFIRSFDSYTHYLLGNIVDSDNNIFYKNVNEISPVDTYKPQIKVFKRNGAACYIDAGATVLDFAFLIHTELGLHFDYAIVNHENTKRGMHYVLSEGDEVEVFASEDISAKIPWFKHAKTSRAIKKLIDYLN